VGCRHWRSGVRGATPVRSSDARERRTVGDIALQARAGLRGRLTGWRCRGGRTANIDQPRSVRCRDVGLGVVDDPLGAEVGDRSDQERRAGARSLRSTRRASGDHRPAAIPTRRRACWRQGVQHRPGGSTKPVLTCGNAPAPTTAVHASPAHSPVNTPVSSAPRARTYRQRPLADVRPWPVKSGEATPSAAADMRRTARAPGDRTREDQASTRARRERRESRTSRPPAPSRPCV
jgi:hypothetical protein